MAQQIDIYASEGIIKIKPKAYITMLKHVLQYGNAGLGANSVEVMGICMGKEENGNMVVYEAVPISHGSAIEVGFTPADYAAFAQVDEEYANKKTGIYACGWYHSHPNMSAFLSGVDIKNQLFYQKAQTPKGFALVFDHNYFDNPEDTAKDPYQTTKLGFKAFRLNDFAKGTSSDFHQSKVEVIPPDDLATYSEIQQIIENSQRKKPIIQEIGGIDVDDSVWSTEEETPSEEKEPTEKVEQKSEVDVVTTAAEQSADVFTKEFTKMFLKNFDEFKNDTTKSVTKGSTIMVDTLATMKETVDAGIGRVKQYMESALSAELKNSGNDLAGTFQKMDAEEKVFNDAFSAFSTKMADTIGDIVKSILSEKLNPVIDSVKKAVEQVSIVATKSQSVKTTINSQQQTIDKLKTSIEKETVAIEETIKAIKEKLGSESKDQIKSLTDSVDLLKGITKDIGKLVSEIGSKLK